MKLLDDKPWHVAAGLNEREMALVNLLASGGDARIVLEPETGLNRYLSAPYPRDLLAYSSSTISDISAPAFAHLLEHEARIAAQSYAHTLADLRARLSAALGLEQGAAEFVFAPSGTDLEYVALACVRERGEGGVHNILLGADETGSGCIHSAHGRYFAKETALGKACEPAQAVPGCGPVSMVDVPVRSSEGIARSSADVAQDMAKEIAAAKSRSAHALIHCVHGSKTGLVLPSLDDLDALQGRFGEAVSVVVDACQARITNSAIAAYLERGAIILMTGSKFIGAPPFNGWALVPPHLAKNAAPLPSGFAEIFRRAEWPEGWRGRDALEDSANLSLALRLEAAAFELERFQAIGVETAAALIDAFEAAVEEHIVKALDVRRVCPGGAGAPSARPIEMRTLITLDVSALPGLATFEDAQRFHRTLALSGVRLGQPVKCVRREGEWGGTLRVGLSMPHMIRWASLGVKQAEAEMARDMRRIAEAITAGVQS